MLINIKIVSVGKKIKLNRKENERLMCKLKNKYYL